LLFVIRWGGFVTFQVTEYVDPAFQTVPAEGRITGGTKTSRAIRGAAVTDVELRTESAKRVVENVNFMLRMMI